jgi:acyl dehydratase
VTAGWGLALGPDSDHVSAAVLAERLGFDHVWLVDGGPAAALIVLGATSRLRVLVTRPESVPLPKGTSARLITGRLGVFAPGQHPLICVRVLGPDAACCPRDSVAGTHLAAAQRVEGTLDQCIAELGSFGRPGTLVIDGPPGSAELIALDGIFRGSRPAGPRHTDDFTQGQHFDLGSYHLSSAEIVDFGQRWDPLDFHIEPHLAVSTRVGRLIASGIHTLAIAQRLAAGRLFRDLDLVAGRGIREARFHRPVYGETTLQGSLDVLEVKRRDQETVLLLARLELRARGELVMSYIGEIVLGPGTPVPDTD